ncbi:uncharacterized protein CLUP02_01973 [Colletotrichum lupini]|uniref:Uncharacterized protein n=1 Tax=Colletotrichum lupini TaxID=145971 RepID=A0A9Q8SDE5_9PEZI|nr:uncharacterized protein CLUP02_01973 [Colletotrichum lupini]UQC75319.1 hypothetical protein CLUP02_01973 [Colletotrichum lupini]
MASPKVDYLYKSLSLNENTTKLKRSREIDQELANLTESLWFHSICSSAYPMRECMMPDRGPQKVGSWFEALELDGKAELSNIAGPRGTCSIHLEVCGEGREERPAGAGKPSNRDQDAYSLSNPRSVPIYKLSYIRALVKLPHNAPCAGAVVVIREYVEYFLSAPSQLSRLHAGCRRFFGNSALLPWHIWNENQKNSIPSAVVKPADLLRCLAFAPLSEGGDACSCCSISIAILPSPITPQLRSRHFGIIFTWLDTSCSLLPENYLQYFIVTFRESGLAQFSSSLPSPDPSSLSNIMECDDKQISTAFRVNCYQQLTASFLLDEHSRERTLYCSGIHLDRWGEERLVTRIIDLGKQIAHHPSLFIYPYASHLIIVTAEVGVFRCPGVDSKPLNLDSIVDQRVHLPVRSSAGASGTPHTNFNEDYRELRQTARGTPPKPFFPIDLRPPLLPSP